MIILAIYLAIGMVAYLIACAWDRQFSLGSAVVIILWPVGFLVILVFIAVATYASIPGLGIRNAPD